MFCKNCGNEMDPNAAFCVHCGAMKGVGTRFCANCGTENLMGGSVCTKCGYFIAPPPGVAGEQKSKVAAGLLGIFSARWAYIISIWDTRGRRWHSF